jgi:CO dehydrogenase maturation factor
MKTGISTICEVAFVGKGGSGKTTCSPGISPRRAPPHRCWPSTRTSTSHLAALGMAEEEAVMLPTLGDHLTEIKDYLQSGNPRIPSAAAMVTTTPPGHGSRLRHGGSGPTRTTSTW